MRQSVVLRSGREGGGAEVRESEALGSGRGEVGKE